MVLLAQGERPTRPTHPTFTDDLWRLVRRCWDPAPHLRPRVSEVLRTLLTPSVPRPPQCSPLRWPDHLPGCIETPAWKHLINLSADECIPLITTIFSHRNGIEMAGRLSGGDAQAFVDAIDEVNFSPITRSKARKRQLTSIESFALRRLGAR